MTCIDIAAMKRPAKKGNRWEDHYTRKARKENYPARSVYKLQEIQKRYRLIKAGDRVLDLGCAPGSWLLYAAQQTGAKGRVVGVDKSPVTLSLPGHAMALTGDVFSMDAGLQGTVGADFDVILSDMSPSTTGRHDVDAARSLALCEAALELTETLLRPGGSFCCKIFTGEDSERFSRSVASQFKVSRIFRPQSTRKASKEIYIIGIGKKTGGLNDVGTQ